MIARREQGAAALPLRTKVLAGLAGGVDTLGIWVILSLAFPVLSLALDVSPAMIGLALMIFRLWDAFTDPFVGWLSDRSRSPWGRRRPFLFAGAILSGLTFPLPWWFSPHWPETAILTWFILTGLLFYTCFTLWAMPYASLLMELSPDYDERTRVFSFRTLFQSFATVLLGSLWWIIQQIHPFDLGPDFPPILQGMRMVAILLGVAIMLLGLLPPLFLRERFAASRTPSSLPAIGLFSSLRAAWANRDLQVLVAIHLLFLLGGGLGSGLGYYITTYYIFQGDTGQASLYNAWATFLFCLANLAGIALFQWLSLRLDKPACLQGSMFLLLSSSALAPFCYTPALPAAFLLCSLFVGLGNAGFFLIGASMLTDVVDLEESRSGNRLEGAFASLNAWSMKLGLSIAFAGSGLLVHLSGFATEDWTAHASSLLTLRLCFVGLPLLLVGLACTLVPFYSLDRPRVRALRASLEARRGLP